MNYKRNILIFVIIIMFIMGSAYCIYYKSRYKIEKISEIVSVESPLGFSGASMNKLELYSNGDVYLIKYNGNGYEDSDIIEKNLIAKKVNSIRVIEDEKSDDFGAVALEGKGSREEGERRKE